MKKLCIISILMLGICYADSMLDNYYQTPTTSSAVNSTGLNQAYTTSRTYLNINQVATNLQNLGMPSKVLNQQINSPSNVLIQVNGTLRDFVNVAAKNFGYTWSMQDTTIVFTAINPVLPKVVSVESTVTPQNTLPQSNSNTNVKVATNWAYAPQDKYVSTVFTKWAKQAGYQLVWQADNDFEVQSAGSIPGGFKTAVNEVLKSFKHSDHPLKAEWYKNNVVVISDLGN